MSLCLNASDFSASWRCGKRNQGMQRGLVGAKRTTNFTSWPSCCPCPQPSPLSWTRPRSSGSASATSSSGTSRRTEIRLGAEIRPLPPKVLKVFNLPHYYFSAFQSFFCREFQSAG